MSTLPLSCKCGRVRGEASGLDPNWLNHGICMCDDCQAYAAWLDRSDVLDTHGGTEIFQTTPAQLQILQGSEQVRCMRLSPKGLLRWYAGCCNTPIANTLASPGAPFAGVPAAFIEAGAFPGRDRVLGPVIVRANARFAKNGRPEGAYDKAPLRFVLRTLRIFAVHGLKGRARPSPFFDDAGKLRHEPRVLSREERDRLRPRS